VLKTPMLLTHHSCRVHRCSGTRRSLRGRTQAAQAAELVRALRHQLRGMTDQLAWVERQHVTRAHGRACAMRLKAAALRRNLKEAQALIDQLQRRYLNGVGSATRNSQLGLFRPLVTGEPDRPSQRLTS
jgi:hypothetical protein